MPIPLHPAFFIRYFNIIANLHRFFKNENNTRYQVVYNILQPKADSNSQCSKPTRNFINRKAGCHHCDKEANHDYANAK